MSKHIHAESYIAEYGIKLMMIFYLASVFFYSEALDPANNFDAKLSVLFVAKLVVLVTFSIVILAVEENIFKIVGFSMIIIGALYKLLILISQDSFAFHELLNLGDSAMLIGVSLYYLYRHQRKKNIYAKKRKSKVEKLNNLD